MLSTGTKVYGGFAGTESLLAQRSTGANVTVLSGDIGLLGENSDNSYHVLTTSNTDTHTILDGFTIIEGNANNISAVYGGGIYNDRGNPTIRNVSIRDNQAMAGGGMYNLGNPTLMNVTFSNNRAPTGLGGGIYNLGRSGPTLANVTFHANIAAGGGGMYNTGSSPTLINVTFTGNQGTQHGGGIFNYSDSRPTLINVILWGDSSEIYNDNGTSTPMISYSVVAGSGGSGGAWNTALGIDGGNNLDVDPLMGFLAENGGFTKTIALLPGSPAIDTGDDANCAATDQRGVTRPQGSHCDIGAYEAEYRPAISGNTGAAGVALSYIDGTSKSITSDGNGNYSISLPVGWAGVVTPNKTGYTFTPANRTYSNLQSDQTSQNYTIQPTTGGADTTGVFRPNNGALYLKNKNETGYADVQINYGIGGDYPVVGDWDGNGTVTIGIYRNGGFYLRNSNTIGFADVVFAFGAPGDQPVAGDWDGDGVDTIGVYRNGMFFLRNQNNSGAPSAIFGLGIPGDVGIAGDWNGDGIDTTGVFRPSNGALYLKNQNTTGFADIQINYGIAGDKPVTGDWDNDGVDTIGVYRNGQFMLRNSNTIGFADIVFALGIPGDVPIAGNWDGLP
jgi:hypothetical protein